MIAIIRLPAATALLALTSLLSCSSSSSHAAGGGNSSPPNPLATSGGQFTINAGSAGMFSCPTSPAAVVLSNTLMVTCSESGGASITTTVATLSIAGYHGSGTYTFQGSASAGKSTLQATIGKTFLDTVPASGSNQATSCTATINGPTTLTEGSEVQGQVQCNNLSAGPAAGSGTSTSSSYVSASADFNAFATL